MELVDTQYNGYIPAYTRTQLTDELHYKFGFRTDYEINKQKEKRNIIKNNKEIIIYAYSLQNQKVLKPFIHIGFRTFIAY